MPRLDEVMSLAAGSNGSAYVTAAGTTSWCDWAHKVDQYRQQVRYLYSARIGLVTRPLPDTFAVLAALILNRHHVYLIDEMADQNTVAWLIEDHGLGAVVVAGPDGLQTRSAGTEAGGSDRGWITLFTSGSTGRPKAVRHSWETLTRPVRPSEEMGEERWLLAYRPHLYAGLQVLMHCLLNQATLVLPQRDASAPEVVHLMRKAGVTRVSATPSYWRWLLTMAGKNALKTLDLNQITLGGEGADQAVLNSLSELFPHARLVHIYATSEAGRCFSVKDGREGFPASFLEAPSPDGVELRIEDGELLVRSLNSMLRDGATDVTASTDAPWLPTGDLVERVGDRIRFVGRRSDIINVGGNKVHPLVVEQVVRSTPGVADTRVYAKRSSLVGQLVACEIAVEPPHDPEQVRSSVQRRCLDELAAHERPRIIEIVSAITLSPAAKKLRQT
jgi:acyl-CoA synthetase (AMP-forming)/AMP-acid ligase II